MIVNNLWLLAGVLTLAIGYVAYNYARWQRNLQDQTKNWKNTRGSIFADHYETPETNTSSADVAYQSPTALSQSPIEAKAKVDTRLHQPTEDQKIRDFTQAQARLIPPDAAQHAPRSPREVTAQALARAGHRPDSWQLTLQDIGLLSSRGTAEPDVLRDEPVPAGAMHIRPFVVIDLPYREGDGPIHFQLYDEAGHKRYDEGQAYRLTFGRNFLAAPRWMALDAERPGGRWTLRVNIGDKPLAVHEFAVRPAATEKVVNTDNLRADGEIDPALIQRLTDGGAADTGLSLDELLTEADAAATQSATPNIPRLSNLLR
jgi:hypothetical protein